MITSHASARDWVDHICRTRAGWRVVSSLPSTGAGGVVHVQDERGHEQATLRYSLDVSEDELAAKVCALIEGYLPLSQQRRQRRERTG